MDFVVSFVVNNNFVCVWLSYCHSVAVSSVRYTKHCVDGQPSEHSLWHTLVWCCWADRLWQQCPNRNWLALLLMTSDITRLVDVLLILRVSWTTKLWWRYLPSVQHNSPWRRCWFGKRALLCAAYHFEGTFVRGLSFWGHFCARPIILRAILRVILHFEGTMGNNIFAYLKRKQYNYDLNII